MDSRAFAYIRLTISPLDGYEITEIDYSDSNITVDDGSGGYDYDGYETVITLADDATIYVTVAATRSGGEGGPGGEMPPDQP